MCERASESESERVEFVRVSVRAAVVVTAIQLIVQCEARDTMKGNFWDMILCLFRMSQCESGGG